MKSLIEKLEAADGPSRELDAEIAVALRLPPPNAPPWFETKFPVWRASVDGKVYGITSGGEDGPWGFSAPFTSSIDAALTLVPEGWRWQIDYDSHRGPSFGASCKKSGDNWPPRIFANHPALALSIAALKAHEALKNDAPDHVDKFIHELRALCKKREKEILTPDDLTYSLRLVADEIDTGELNEIRG